VEAVSIIAPAAGAIQAKRLGTAVNHRPRGWSRPDVRRRTVHLYYRKGELLKRFRRVKLPALRAGHITKGTCRQISNARRHLVHKAGVHIETLTPNQFTPSAQGP